MVTGANFYSYHSLQSVSGSIKLIFPIKLGNMDLVNKEYLDYRFSTVMMFQNKSFLKHLMKFDKEQKLPNYEYMF